MRRSLIYCAFGLANWLMSGPVTAADRPELLVGPISYQQDVNGIPVDIVASTYFTLINTDKDVTLHARVVGDLSDLQRKIGAIVDTFPLPSDNCRSYSANNPVVGLPRKELFASDDGAVFSLGGSVAMWDCRENPAPNSKVEWQVKSIGLGVKTKVPVVKTWPGDPIKNKLGSQSFDVDIPLSIVHDAQSVSLTIGRPKVDLNGQYASITEGILRIAGIDINQKLYDALQKAIDPDKLRAAVPVELQEFNPEITEARFVPDGTNLQLELTLSSTVPAATLTNIVTGLIPSKT